MILRIGHPPTPVAVPQRSLMPYIVLGVIALAVLWALVATGTWSDILRYRKDILYLTRQHLVLVAVSGSLAILSGVGLGIGLSRPAMRRYAEPPDNPYACSRCSRGLIGRCLAIR